MKKISCLLILFTLISFNVFANDYVIGDGDTLQISVWGSPELSLENVTVRPDGKVSMPALGDVRASGLTPNELKNYLDKKLKDLVKKPVVTVIVTKMMNYQINVFGDGTTPGIHTLERKTTLLEFLSSLGSLENADLEKAYLMRDKRKIKESFHELFRKGDLAQDIVLKPDDILFIPDNFEKRITIVGEVTNPTTVRYKEGLTILDIILSAQGFTEFAKKNDVEIIRTAENGQKTIKSIRVKDLMKGDLEKNIKIKPGDFIVVKESLF